MTGARFRSIVAGVATLVLGATIVVVTDTPPAQAGPSGDPKDSTLSALSVSASSITSIAPAFDPGTHLYQAVSYDSDTATVTPVRNNTAATMVVTDRGTTIPVSGGAATAPLVRGRNDITVTVTSQDQSTTTVYTAVVWRNVAPTPGIESLPPIVTLPYGGTRFDVRLSDGALPSACSRIYRVRGSRDEEVGAATFDPVTGLTDAIGEINQLSDESPGPADLTITTVCNPPGGSLLSTVTAPNAVTVLDKLTVTGADVPATVSVGSVFRIRGPGITYESNLAAWLEDADGTRYELSQWGWTGPDQTEWYLDYYYEEQFFETARAVTFHVGHYPPTASGLDDAVSDYARTVNFVPPAPTIVSMSPSSGPLSGGSTFTLRGRYIYSYNEYLTIRVGGERAKYDVKYNAYGDSSSYSGHVNGLDVVEVQVPPGVVPGLVPVTVSTEYGEVTASTLFRYSARPQITSIAPSTVAWSGGSVITVTGTDLGTAGTPTVVIGGTRSPLVTRVSDTQLTAVVPPSTGTGTVAVTVASPQGGGVSPAADLTLADPGSLPTISKVSPASGASGDPVTITGTNFGPSGTAAVRLGDAWVRPTAATATSLTFAIPAGAAAGAQSVSVGTPTGLATAVSQVQVQPPAGITAVAPVSVPSYATGSAAQVALTGAGFATTGTVQVGAAKAVAYTATSSGTRISGVTVPTGTVGVLPVLVTPKGSKTPLRATVRVTGPTISYVGSNPYATQYDINNVDNNPQGGLPYPVETPGGTPSRIQGTGFGTGGVLTVAGKAVTTTSWSDTAITFLAPAHAAGTVPVAVAPSRSAVAASRASGITYIPVNPHLPTITRIASVVDNSYPDRTEFDEVADASAAFTLTGQYLAGTSAAATSVVISDGTQSFTVTPTAVTATSLNFNAPRTFGTTGEWKSVQVITNVGDFTVGEGVYYRAVGGQVSVSPDSGYCGKTTATASGSVTYPPTSVAIQSTVPAFSTAGTVTVDGVTVGTTSWSESLITLNLANLATPLTNPWGVKTFVVTPTDTSVPPRSVSFTCAVTPAVTTTANGSPDPLTVQAGTAFTIGSTNAGFIGPFSATAPGGYEYVTDADHTANGFNQNVYAGVPSAAGDYWVRVALARATYDRAPYRSFTAAPVHITITGQPVTLTVVSDNGSSFEYKGPLAAPGDFHYTATATADPITKVYYEYRDAVCSGQGDGVGWHDGLPGDVAVSDPGCGGDGMTHSTWQVRVKSFEMIQGGTDHAGYYVATRPVATVDITPRSLTIDSVRADKVYDGTDNAPLGDLSVSGALAGDEVALADDVAGTFADATAGVDKPVTLTQDVGLDGAAQGNYTLTNPRPTVVGTISKATARLALQASPGTVLLSQSTPIAITPTVVDPRTNNPPDGTAAPVVLTSQTPSVCSVSETTVTALAAGTCTIAGTQAASANYEAATALADPSSDTATVQVQVFAAPQTISVLADDLTVGEGDTIEPTVQVSGLFDGDSVDNVDFDYYDGATLLTGPPTAVGTYKIMPKGGTLSAATSVAYSNPTAFTYVPGTLVITPVPPSITVVNPHSGPYTGGTPVTVTGTRLDSVDTVRIGTKTLSGGDFTVNGDGTSLTFVAPAVSQAGTVDLVLTAGTATVTDVYTYLAIVPSVPRAVVLTPAPTSITVAFTVPASNGGAAISSYEASLDGGTTWTTREPSCQGSTCTIVLAELTGNTPYTVGLRAVNEIGPGAAAIQLSATNVPWHPPLTKPPGTITVPPNPDTYTGPQHFTSALYTTYGGKPAGPIASLGAHQMVTGDAVTTLRGELFAFDSAALTAAGRAAVKTVAQHLHLAHHVTCEGYTDYAGDAAHEKALSAARAKVICQTLLAYGAHVAITSVGYGGARPVVVGGTPQSRAENRRVVIRVDN